MKKSSYSIYQQFRKAPDMDYTITSPDFSITKSIESNVLKKWKSALKANHHVYFIGAILKKERMYFDITFKVFLKGRKKFIIIKQKGEDFYPTLSMATKRLKARVASYADTIKKTRNRKKLYQAIPHELELAAV